MTKKFKKIALGVLATMFVGTLAAAALPAENNIDAAAQTNLVLNENNFKVGAAVRLKKSETDTTGDGIRFSVMVKKDAYEQLGGNFLSGTMLLPEKISDGKELIADFTGSTPVVEDSDISHTPTKNSEVDVWSKYTDNDGVEWMQAAVYLWDIPAVAYDAEILARGYILDLDDGTVYYTNTTERSIAYVANAALNDPAEDWDTTEQGTLKGYIPTYDNIVVQDDNGTEITSLGNNAYGDTVTYTPNVTEGTVKKVFYDGEELTADENGTYAVTIKNDSPIVVGEYIEVSTAEQFKTMDLTANNYILTADIDLGDIASSMVATNISAAPDGGSGYQPSALIAKVEKHLDGDGNEVTYSFTGNGSTKYALIGILNGKISNLEIDATTRAVTNNAVFATHAWSDAVVENCYIKVTTATNDNNDDQQGVFIRFGGQMINTVIELNVLTDTNTRFHAIAYGPAFGPTFATNSNDFSFPTFENVVIVAKSTQAIYNNGGTTATGVSVYTDKAAMLETHDFSNWDSSIWTVEKDGDTVTDLVFGRPLPPVTYLEVSTAEEFLAMDLTANNYILTADIDLGDIASSMVATNISASKDGASGFKPSALIAKVEKHLDGNGHKVAYSYSCYGGSKYALIGILDGKISNLEVDATVRMVYDNAVLASHAWDNAIVENCYIKVTTATNDNTASPQGVFVRFGGTMKNTIIELNVMATSGNEAMHAIAYGPAMQTTTSYIDPTFEDVVVVAPTSQNIYNGATSAEGVSVYNTQANMYEHDFSMWNTDIWTIEKDVDGNVTGVSFGVNPQ